MTVATAGSDWVAIASVVIGFVLTLLASLIAYIFHDLRREVRTNGRHIDSMMASTWELIWRMVGVEEFLDDQGYHPPRIIPKDTKS